MRFIDKWKQWTKKLKAQVLTLYLAAKDPRVPWYARAATAIVVGYAVSPIDIIPDFIPILGYLDDALLIPLGIAVVIKMMPKEVYTECKQRAAEMQEENLPTNWAMVTFIVAIWVIALVGTCWLLSAKTDWF